MRRSRDEPPAESHAPTRDEVMKGFAVWRAGRSAASPSPVKPPRRTLWAILTGRRPPNPFRLEETQVMRIVADLRAEHPRFELDVAADEPAAPALAETAAPPIQDRRTRSR